MRYYMVQTDVRCDVYCFVLVLAVLNVSCSGEESSLKCVEWPMLSFTRIRDELICIRTASSYEPLLV